MSGNFTLKIRKTLEALATRHLTIECDHLPHGFDRVPLKKLLNWIAVETSVFFKPERPWGWPTHLLVEPTNVCNIRCALCPVTKGLRRPSGRMSFERFKKVIDEIGDYLFLILLWDWGEPFLNPRVYDMIEYAKRKGIQITSSTNGHVFARKGQAEKLVRSGIDSLVFAVDGMTQETYEKYRQGGKLEEVLTGIRNVVEAKKALNSKKPLLNLRFIVMKHNEHEVPNLADFARNLGVDVATLRTLHPYDDDRLNDKTVSGDFVPGDKVYRRFSYDAETRSRIRRRHNPCKALWNNPSIHWDGAVCGCSFDPHDQYVLGNLDSQSFREIWFGAPYRTFRRRFRRDYRQLALCKDCTYAFEGGACSTEDIIQTVHLREE